MMLCLLAALFAMEAKIAWFSPAGSPTAQISYAKARPAEHPKMLEQLLAAPELPAHEFSAAVPLLALALALVTVTSALAAGLLIGPAKVSSAPAFSASLYFRPPPSA